MSSLQPTTWARRTREGRQRIFAVTKFARLKWSVFEPLSTVQVLDLDDHDEPRWTPLFDTRDGEERPVHPLGNELATNTPLSRMRVVLRAVESWEFWQDAETEPPAPLLIENQNNEPITIAQFITHFHSYALGLRDALYEALGIYNNEECSYFFCYGPSAENVENDDALFEICVKPNSELTEFWDRSVERFRQLQNRQQQSEKQQEVQEGLSSL
ncbi:hypothetical protein F4810DRAFT_506082 [Camillea tinctor]|nr:hypothetical protein F4810DRAFT_506082 [Camillea tinctor]